MTDRLDAITAALARWDRGLALMLNPLQYADLPRADWDDVRWLVAEVRRLRQRHAEAVEAAFREGYEFGDRMIFVETCDAAWLTSDARKGVARDDG